MTFKLFKIFASNLFSFQGLTNKKGGKSVARIILFAALFLYIIAAFTAIYSVLMYSIYGNLKHAGTTRLMPVIAMTVAICAIFFFGISSVATNYFTGNGEEQFLSMPISSSQLFGAKFGVSVVFDAILGFALFAIASFIYGYNEGLLGNPLFYVGLLVSAVTISLVAIAIIYFLLILVLYFIPALRKRNLLTGIASVFIIIFAICYGFCSSQFGNVIGSGNSAQMTKLADPIVQLFTEVDSKLSFLKFLADALNGKIIPIIVMMAVSAFIIFGFVPFAGKLYIQTFNGFSDIKTKKLTSEKAEETIKEIKTNSVFKAFYIRDLRTVLREPTFFANGPLMIILLPVIICVTLVFSVFVQGGENFTELKAGIVKGMSELPAQDFAKIQYYIILIAAALTNFMGNSTSIASSSFSREGKSLYDLKAMPVTNLMLAKVKFWHAMTYVFVSDLIIVSLLIAGILILGLPFGINSLITIVVMIIIVNTAVSLPIIFMDMFMDTANPKLNWENPIAAFKQNMNSVVAVFATMIIDGIFVILGVFVLPKSMVGLVSLAVIFTVIGAPLGVGYFKYAEKKITKM